MHGKRRPGDESKPFVALICAFSAVLAVGCSLDWSGPDAPECGNNVAEPGEPCDGADLGGATCATLGYDSGDLACTATCTFDASACSGEGICGNGIVDPDEECDQSNLGGQTCVGLGWDSGELGCTAGCLFDLSGCLGDFDCGNGLREPTEECDGTDLGGETCQSRGFAAGSLSCDGTCAFDTSACVQPGICGNGVCEPLHQNAETWDSCPDDCAWTAIAAGYDHTCGIRADTYVWCWGQGSAGQLGAGSWNDSDVPVRSEFSDAGAVAAGGYHTCARAATGSLWCWGRGESGQLGNQGTADAFLPDLVYDLSGMTQLATGGEHTCATASSGSVWCWGLNDLGQVGDPMVVNATAPVAVANFTGTYHRGLSAGDRHSCIIDEVYVLCWGANESGQLGNGSTSGPDDCSGTPCSTEPVQGLAMGGVSISAGGRHTCMRHDLDYAVCWGANDHGQLGSGDFVATTQPVEVTGLTGAVLNVCAGFDHSCALVDDNSVWCWGRNDRGQLGNGTTASSAVPVQVAPMTGASRVTCGRSHTCALRTDGSVWCWGENTFAQLGDGTTQDRLTPVRVADVSPE